MKPVHAPENFERVIELAESGRQETEGKKRKIAKHET
jgi:hypothetical protein